MDRSLVKRTIALIFITIIGVCILLPTFLPRGALPSFLTDTPVLKWVFSSRMSWGLDLQGGLHLVYSIDLDKAVDDRASELKRDIESSLVEGGIKGSVRTPSQPLGAVTINLTDATKLDEVKKTLESTYGDTITMLDCPKTEAAGSICMRVSSSYADGIKKAALTNAVLTIRERINEKGVAEPNVVEKGDDIIVELPGLDKEMIDETKGIIARTAKLEMKVVDDCTTYVPSGCTAANSTHDSSPYMRKLFKHIGSDRKGNPTDVEALRLGITVDVDQWRPEEGGATHTDYYMRAKDREEAMPVAWAKKHGCLTKDSVVENGKTTCLVTGRQIIERYIFGDKELGYPGLVAQDPKGCVWTPSTPPEQGCFVPPDDRQVGFEIEEQPLGSKEKLQSWRTYYLERAVRLTGSAIANAMGSYDPNTNRPIVLLDFNRYGGRVFGDVTSAIVGMKFATILDDKVKSAPLINQAIRGGRASITMGGGDVRQQEKERDDLVAVLKTGSLPAPLREESASEVGPSLGLDAIEKTRFSFLLGILLVFAIMIGIYRWSGFIAVFSVLIFIVLTLAVMALFGATLTLPGIAAIVLSVGMVVDGNILIYERIRDELNQGKSVRGAIDTGFSRVFSAILDGQLSTAAAGWVLLNYGSGPIKGFAVMLLVGCFTHLFVNMWVTRVLFDWVIARKKNANIQTLSI